MTRALLDRELSPAERVGLSAALGAVDARCSEREVVIPDVVAELREPSAELALELNVDQQQARDELRECILALRELSTGPLRGMLLGQTVVVIGGSAGISLETARRARAEGADLVLTARNPERLEQAGVELRARSTAAFDASDPASLERFFEDLPTQIDHVLVSGGGPHYKPPLEMDTEEARVALSEQTLLALAVAPTPAAG